MIHAEIAGKLREIENWEDALTSNVFGTLAYAHPRWMALLLQDLQEKNPREIFFNDDWKFELAEVSTKFWPKWPETRGGFTEPDVVQHLFGTAGEVSAVIGWECKLGALLGGDQLERECRGLILHEPSVPKIFVHLAKPGERARIDFLKRRNACSGVPVLHYTWSWLCNLVSDMDLRDPAVAEVAKYLKFKNFDRFRGFEANETPRVSSNHGYGYSSGVKATRYSWPANPFVTAEDSYEFG